MSKSKVTLLITSALAVVLICGSIAEAGIARVARRINVMSFYAGSSNITGSYKGFGDDDWRTVLGEPLANPDVKGSDMFKSSLNFGLNYGQIRNGHVLVTVGFEYTNVKLEDEIIIEYPAYYYTFTPNDVIDRVSLFDITFGTSYLFNDIQKANWTPYIGGHLKGGMMVFKADGFSTENELKLSGGVDFGLDLKIWSDKFQRTFITLSSINSVDLFASGNRPRYFSIGGGIKYFFRP